MRFLALLSVLLLFLPGTTVAQDVHGRLEGRVVGSDGSPVATAGVTVEGPALQGKRRAETDELGYFSFPALPVGSYTVLLERLGYDPVQLDDVVVLLGRTTTTGTIFLAASPIPLETLFARMDRLLIDPESTAGGVNLTPELYDNLPNDRDYRSLITVSPAVNEYLGGDLSVSGGTGPEMKFFVEGADVTDPVNGIGPTRLPYNFVREIEIKTGGYEAEYRGTLGGIANVITYSGSNDFRSEVFGYFTSDRLEGTPRFGLSESTQLSSAQYDLGISLGGPILRDRLWYFVAYNPSVTTEDIEIPAHGVYDDHGVQHVFAGKLTWQAAEGTSLSFSTFGDPGTRDMVQPMSISTAGFTPLNPETWLGELSYGSVHFVGRATQQLGRKALLEATLSTASRNDSYMPTSGAGYEVQVHDLVNQTVSGGTTKYGEKDLSRTSLTVKTTWDLGRHTVKAGGEYSTSGVDTRSYTHNVIKRIAENNYREVVQHNGGSLQNRVGGLFVQDSWMASDRWRFNLGLRWEAQGFVGTDGEVAQTIPDQFAPRFGVIFLPGEPGTQRLYASAGRFYQDFLLSGSTYYSGESTLVWTGCDTDPREPAATCEVLTSTAGVIANPVEGLSGQYYDEITLGYDRQVGSGLKLGARGVYRTLRRAIEDAVVDEADEDGEEEIWILGNPGYGPLSAFPAASRTYAALELIAEKTVGTGLMLAGSYVLSRTEGNYGGLFDTDYWQVTPNTGVFFDHLALMENSDGLLPQDRRHSLKLSASYMTGIGLGLGGRFLWATGTPLNIRGGSPYPPEYMYLVERGLGGKTPAIWDLDLRVVYDMSRWLRRKSPARIVLDVFNVGSPREPVAYDEVWCLTMTPRGNQTDVNPSWGQPTRFQPPMTVRLGLEIEF